MSIRLYPNSPRSIPQIAQEGWTITSSKANAGVKNAARTNRPRNHAIHAFIGHSLPGLARVAAKRSRCPREGSTFSLLPHPRAIVKKQKDFPEVNDFH